MKKNQKVLAKPEQIVYGICFCVAFALLILAVLNYVGIFKLFHKTQNWYYVTPSTLAMLGFAAFVLACFLWLISFFDKTCLSGVPLKEIPGILKTKKGIVRFVCLLCFFAFFILTNCLFYTAASEKGFFKNGKPMMSFEQITQVDVAIEDAQIVSGVKAILHKTVIACKIQADDSAQTIDSDFFFGFERLDAFLQQVPKEKKQVHAERLQELLEFLQKRNTGKTELEAVKHIFHS